MCFQKSEMRGTGKAGTSRQADARTNFKWKYPTPRLWVPRIRITKGFLAANWTRSLLYEKMKYCYHSWVDCFAEKSAWNEARRLFSPLALSCFPYSVSSFRAKLMMEVFQHLTIPLIFNLAEMA